LVPQDDGFWQSIDALIVNHRPISMQKRQTIMRATCSRMSMTISGGSWSFWSSLLIFE
jgi:hypothetical protein